MQARRLLFFLRITPEKARLLYDEIDQNSKFVGYANKEDRSIMNVTFNLVDKSLEKKFDDLCYEQQISGIKGHRSIGGYRASLYNALSIESVNTLINVMRMI